MNVILDTSVVLRVVFGADQRLSSWGEWDDAYASALLAVEAFRRLSNARLEGLFDDETVVAAISVLREILDNLTLVDLTEEILARASEQFPTILGTLDALHVATAVALAESGVENLVLATHDEQQGRAAVALGLTVTGLKGAN